MQVKQQIQDNHTHKELGHSSVNASGSPNETLNVFWLAPENNTFTWQYDSFLQFAFVLEGEINFFLPDKGKQTAQAGKWLAVSLDGWTANCRIAPNTRILVLESSHQLWDQIVTDEDKLQHTQKACITCSQRNEAVFFVSTLNHPMLEVLLDISAIKEGSRISDQLRTQAKALELLAQISESTAISDSPEPNPCFRSGDEEALKAAANYLEQNLDADHSLAEISKKVHLNEFKLKKGFKEYFNTTVFGYLRQKRMEQARYLLTRNRVSVLEIAQAVGYSNPSHFTRAFRNAFGINPKKLLVAERRNALAI